MINGISDKKMTKYGGWIMHQKSKVLGFSVLTKRHHSTCSVTILGN